MPEGVHDDHMVLFAVPKKGRIHEEVMKLLAGAGLEAKRPERLDVAVHKELPLKLVFLPAADIPQYVMEGNVDIGISGSDMLEEAFLEAGHATSPVQVMQQLGIGKCKLCLQAPKEKCSQGVKALVGKRIVTSFPALSRRFFENHSLKESPATRIKVVSGSVEAACGLGLADAIVDLVETGTTMRAAGLDIVADVLETEALLFRQKQTNENRVTKEKSQTLDMIDKRIRGYITATRYVMVLCNVHDDNLAAVGQIMPGKRSPTVTALTEAGWHSVSALVKISESNKVMDELAKAGATDILATSLSNTRM